MTESERYWRGCQRKIYFSTRKRAKIVAARLKLRVYECQFCHGFHVTSNHSKRKRCDNRSTATGTRGSRADSQGRQERTARPGGQSGTGDGGRQASPPLAPGRDCGEVGDNT